ncbi:hypothetical protein A9179_04410 [Pseudomonas alcaligenes]|uniref:Cadherin domain-containing protein n=1 Tax=Aquipseudomonas alcaligenes TaxID=43263 RepID=A0ABR7RXN4_AQUAC|nr:cadherin domain-containing protein [Pseudomonas alcaligenes]MBC9249517.1 hypothetical protein [Pseudomonas alcaligenes]
MADLTGTSGNDSLNGTNKNDTLIAGAGDDSVDAGNGNDIVDGGSGNDNLQGGNGDDTLYGGTGNDQISGGNGQDLIYGGSGNDIIGTSLINSENGNDVIYGDGWDDYRQQTRALVGDDIIYGGNGSETIYGDNGDGGASGGNDTIYAGNGNDTIYGEGGNDTIQGGNGADVLSGGSGNDTFVYQSAAESNASEMDTIRDFSGVRDSNPDNDKLDLRPLLGAADLKWGGTSATVNGVWYEQNASQNATYVKADTTGDGKADLVIRLDGLKDLSNTDFLGVQNNGPTITSNGGGSTAALAINENNTAVTTVTASDPDSGALLTYSIVGGADSGRFAIDANTGALTFISAPNRESPNDSNGDSTYEVVVRVSDGSAFDDQTLSIAINDVDEFDVSTPIDSNGTANSVNENVSVGTAVGITAFASDGDATTNGVTYSLTSNPGGLFAINANTGVVTTAAAINREALGASVNIQVTATSADGSTAAQTFSIAINDVDEFDVSTPVDSNAAANAIDENVAVGTQVGITAFASDSDATTNGVTYSLSDDAGGLFTIDANTGVVTTAAAIDRELLGSSLNIEVTATSADGSTAAQTFSIAINDVDEFDVSPPVDSNAAANAIDENTAIGTEVGITAFASDADATTNTVTYSLSSNPGGLFAIDTNTGVVTTAAAIDREALGSSLNIEVTATSADGSTAAQTFSIAINDVDEFDVSTPVDSNGTANAVNENASVGTAVGITAFASDADATTNGVTYSLSSNPGGLFAIDANTGMVTTAAAINREALGASVNIEVTATSADGSTAAQTFSIAINDVDEFDVSTPIDSDGAANAIDENVAVGTEVGVTAFASDSDATTNTVTYSLSSNPDGLFAIDANTGMITTAAAIDRELLGSSLNIEVTATSADGSTAAQTFSIAINDVDEFDVSTPIDSDAAANAIDENTAIGTEVGITAFASDGDATTNGVTYSLSSNPGGLFAIDANTGVVTTAAVIDREALGSSLNIEVTATSADGSTAAQTFSIAINDVDEFDVSTPVDSNGTANAVNENASVGTAVGITAFASDADATTNGVTYSLSSNPGGLFAIDANTGMVTTAAAINREALGASVNIEVTSTSADGSTAAQTFSIAINDVDEFDVSTPVDSNAATNAIDENVTIGTEVGITAFASDSDATTNTVTYSLSSNPGGLFAIDTNTGVVTTAAAIDREALGSSLNIEVTATSADGSTAAQTFSIAINDVDEFDVSTPTDTNAGANAIDENIAIGTEVGVTAFASDSDATTNGVTYSLSDDAGGLFTIDANTGVVTTAAAIDRELLGSSLNIEVTATSADGSTAAQTFSIAINDVDEFDVSTPIDSNGAANAVNENVSIGTEVGITAFASDADATTNGVTYNLSSNPGGLFAIDANTGVVTTAAAIDREALGASVNIEVTATSADGSTAAQTFSIAINNLNDNPVVGPVDGNAAANSVAENAAIGTSVGITAQASDADAGGQAITYTLSDSAGGRYAINSSTGVVTVAGALDYETATSHNITVLATSADGSSNSSSFTINVSNLNDNPVVGPVDGNAAANSVAENAAIGTSVGITAQASDADAGGQAITYTLSDNAGGRFAINSSTGVITVAGALDYEAATSHNITVLATSADGSSNSSSFTINVSNLNDNPVVGPVDGNAAANSVAENAAIGTSVGITAQASDADAGGQAITYTLSDNAGGRFAINSSTGVVTVAGALDYETATSHNITVLATSADGSSNSTGFTINVSNLNDNPVVGPVDGNAAANSVAENAAIGTSVGITAQASDADAGGQAITYTLSDNAGGRFAINSSTGVVTVAGALDYETATSHNITVLATSADGSSNSTSFVIGVSDINDTADPNDNDPSVASPFTAGNDSQSNLNSGTYYAGTGNDTMISKNSSTVVFYGGSGNDTLNGSDNNDSLYGGSGTDTIDGGKGNDRIVGGFGADTLTGGTASGANNDTFVNLALDDVGDHITDFEAGTNTTTVDKLEFTVTASRFALGDLDAIVENFRTGNNAALNLAGTEVAIKTDAAVATANIQATINGFSNITSGALFVFLNSTVGHAQVYYDPNPSVAGGAVLVADLDNLTTLTSLGNLNAGDFAFGVATAPAGIAGEPINLGLSNPAAQLDGSITATLNNVPGDWIINGATRLADGSWVAHTGDLSSLTVTTPSDFLGAAVLSITLDWVNTDGSHGVLTVADNVEAYAAGSPIFALSSDDNLTASSGADLFVFAQPIAHNQVFDFDVAADRLDLIGFGSGLDFASLQIANDASGNAVITLGESSSITLRGVDASELGAANFVFDLEPTLSNSGTLVIHDGAVLPLGGVVDNSGSILLDAGSATSQLEVLVESLTLRGGGQLTLSDNANNLIIGGAATARLLNENNTISGAGQIGGGQMTLLNAGLILASGANALVLDTGTTTISNSGTLESTGAGGMTVASALDNSGHLWANGGDLRLLEDVTGNGSASLSGDASLSFGGAAHTSVAFLGDGAGTLVVEHAADAGSLVGILGLESNDMLVFGDVAFGPDTQFSYTANSLGSGGRLTLDDGVHNATVNLLGHYSEADFQLGAAASGTQVGYQGAASGTLVGSMGADTLHGGAGNDVLAGRGGEDVLSGGAGADVFAYLSQDDGGDSILDFNASEGDALDLSALLDANFTAGSQVSDFVRLTQSGADITVQVDVDGANNGAQFTNLVTLSNYATSGSDYVNSLFAGEEHQLSA